MTLTERQIIIIKRIAFGYKYSTIAEELKVSPKTVDYHVGQIKRRLGVSTLAGIIHYGIARLKVPLLFTFLLLLARPARGGSVPLKWDPSPSPGVTYVLYATTNASLVETNLAKSQVIIDVGTNTTVTAYTLPAADGLTWRFAVTANLGGAQSAPSNVLPQAIPAPPGELATVLIQYSGTLEGISSGQTNLFIRVKFGLP